MKVNNINNMNEIEINKVKDNTKLTTEELANHVLIIDFINEFKIKEENSKEFIKHHWTRIKKMINELKNGTLKDITDLTYEIMLLQRTAESRGYDHCQLRYYEIKLEDLEEKRK